jgi:hypothetical protein
MLALKPERPISPITLRPGVKPNPPMQYRVRIIADTLVKGVIVWKGTVVDVMVDDWLNLRDSLKGVKVDDNTPLVMAPAPVDPYADRPKLFLDCVESGMNNLNDIFPALNVRSKIEASKIAKGLIDAGLISLNDRGVYIRTAKKAA